MTYLHLSYDNLFDLIRQFERLDVARVGPPPARPNFTIVKEADFDGSYGGIWQAKAVERFVEPCVASAVADGHVLVWWTHSSDRRGGDFSLAKNGYALVTPDMYRKMEDGPRFKKPKSSYF